MMTTTMANPHATTSSVAEATARPAADEKERGSTNPAKERAEQEGPQEHGARRAQEHVGEDQKGKGFIALGLARARIHHHLHPPCRAPTRAVVTTSLMFTQIIIIIIIIKGWTHTYRKWWSSLNHRMPVVIRKL
jgi:hypothetical protein